MKQCYITVRDEVFCFITGLQPSDTDFLWNEFGVFVDGYFFMPQYKMGRWDGKVRFFEKTGKTYIRLLDSILPYLEKWGYNIVVKDERINSTIAHPPHIDEKWFARKGAKFKNNDILIRPYQIDAINACVEFGDGFILAGTGAGKSLMCAGLCDVYGSVGHRTITVVPSSDLVTQTADWYKLCLMDTGIYSGTEKDIYHQHVVATWQSLQNNPKIIQDFTVFVWDEAHGCKATVAQDIINKHGRNIPFRFGCTGTLPKPKTDAMALKASIGDVRVEIPARWLMDNGYLAKVEIEPIEINETYIDEEFPDYASERAFITKSPSRLDLIADLIITKAEQYGNTLVLVTNVKFGEELQKLIKDSAFLYGATERDDRKDHYDQFESNNDLIKIATFGIASTGISIDRVFCLIMVDAGKSFIKAIQSIGRGTRLAADKTNVHCVDIYSSLKWSKKHAKERKKFYAEAEYPCSNVVKLKLRK